MVAFGIDWMERKILPLFLVLMSISVSNSAFQEQSVSPIAV